MKEKDVSIDVLKFLAIFAVVGIHALGFLEQMDLKRVNWNTYIAVDQIFRFCVPLFVAISGFMLSKRYVGTSINWKVFFLKRFRKTIPLYLLWSGVFVLLTQLIPSWGGFSLGASPSRILFWGQADYHLYFVPMITCLYVLFPFVLLLTKKFKFLFLIFVFLLQMGLYYWISLHLDLSWKDIKPFYSDQQQYIFFGTWIFYFVLGTYLGLRKNEVSIVSKATAVVLVITGGLWAIYNAQMLFKNGVDVLFACRFTRLPILLYSSGVVCMLLFFRLNLLKLPNFLLKSLGFLGRQSFLIYLCHTLVLRIVFGYFNQDTTTYSLLVATGLLVVGIGASVLVEKFS